MTPKNDNEVIIILFTKCFFKNVSVFLSMSFHILFSCCSKTFVPSKKCVKTVKKVKTVFQNDVLFQEICKFIENTFFITILFLDDLLFSHDKLKKNTFYFNIGDCLSLKNDKIIYITEISLVFGFKFGMLFQYFKNISSSVK